MSTTAVGIGSHLHARASFKWACVYTRCYYTLSEDRECVQYQRVQTQNGDLWVRNEKARRDERQRAKQPVCKLRIGALVKLTGTFSAPFVVSVISCFGALSFILLKYKAFSCCRSRVTAEKGPLLRQSKAGFTSWTLLRE